MADSQNLHLLYKNLGETPHEVILRWKKEHPEYENVPMTYAGRLDPMAEGLLLVLSGDGVMEKDKYLDLPKTYEFEILWGFETDTLDLLGLVEENSFDSHLSQSTHNFGAQNLLALGSTASERLFSRNESTNFPAAPQLKEYFNKGVGKSEQIYPVYSSRPVNGKSLFQWAREGRLSEIDIPKHDVELYQAEYISRRSISNSELLADIKNKVGLVKGDFRQKEIVEKWEKVLSDSKDEEFTIDKIKIVVSSGFYVRQFVSDLASSFDTKAVTFHIKRTRIGEYC